VFNARQLLAMPDPLRTGVAAARHKALFSTLTGRGPDQWDKDCDTVTTGRLALAILAPIVTAYEHAMTDAEGRNTWRTDRCSPCPRGDAGIYLAFLASIGHALVADLGRDVGTGGRRDAVRAEDRVGVVDDQLAVRGADRGRGGDDVDRASLLLAQHRSQVGERHVPRACSRGRGRSIGYHLCRPSVRR